MISAATKKLLLGTTPIVPQLIIIGAQKGGTTSLFQYLSLHPQVTPPQVKEVDYFNALGTSSVNAADYHGRFPIHYGSNTDQISLDVSPAYMLDADAVATSIWSYNSNIKIVVSLREPVSRAISAWFMYKKFWLRNPNWFIDSEWVKHRTNQNIMIDPRTTEFGKSFADDIREEIDVLSRGHRIDMPIVEYGLYAQQLRPFYERFGTANIMVLESQELDVDTQGILDRVTDFIGLPRHTWDAAQLIRHFKGDNKESIDQADIEFLTEYYLRHNQGLEAMVGMKFAWMSS